VPVCTVTPLLHSACPLSRLLCAGPQLRRAATDPGAETVFPPFSLSAQGPGTSSFPWTPGTGNEGLELTG
jgi:hypothetical protein